MQDSFRSFKDIFADKWVVNVRGRYNEQTLDFLKLHLGNKLFSYKLNSKEGWFYDTRQMLNDLDGTHIFFWLEDHIYLSDINELNLLVTELYENQIDYMMYSYWWDGALRQRYKGIILNSGVNIDWFNHTVNNNSIIQGNAQEGVFIIAACAIFKNELFRKIVLRDDPLPKRWPKETPFDFEKGPLDVHWLPLKVALMKKELFASIDDDHVHPGSSLISRGLYPFREQRQSYAVLSNGSIQRKIRDLVLKLHKSIIFRNDLRQ